MPPSRTGSPPSTGSAASHQSFADNLATGTIESLALSARIRASSAHSPVTTLDGLTCTVSSPPKQGSFNVVYEAQFSTGHHGHAQDSALRR